MFLLNGFKNCERAVFSILPSLFYSLYTKWCISSVQVTFKNIFSQIFGELRNTYYYCDMKLVPESEKRFTNSYKCTNNVYNKAMKRAKKEKLKLSQLIEVWVTSYANGMPYYIDSTETPNLIIRP